MGRLTIWQGKGVYSSRMLENPSPDGFSDDVARALREKYGNVTQCVLLNYINLKSGRVSYKAVPSARATNKVGRDLIASQRRIPTQESEYGNSMILIKK